jgi:hypothetical protein
MFSRSRRTPSDFLLLPPSILFQANGKRLRGLSAENKYPPVVAMSGWSHRDTITTVSGRDWTSEVTRTGSIIGHVPQSDERRDRGVPGQLHACHAEKQLIAYFISRHVFSSPKSGGLGRDITI